MSRVGFRPYERRHFVAALAQRLGDGRADVTGAAGEEDSQLALLLHRTAERESHGALPFRLALLVHELGVLLALGGGLRRVVAERDALAAGVDAHDADDHFVGGADGARNLLRDLRVRHQADEARLELDEDAGTGDVIDRSFDDLADRIALARRLPRIAGRDLAEGEREALLGRIDLTHPSGDGLADLEVGRLHAERKLRHVNETIEPRLDFDEEAEIGRAEDAAAELRAGRVAILDVAPGIALEFFHREGDALPVVLDFDDADVDFLSDLHQLLRIADAAAAHLRNVEKAVDAAEVDEGAKRHERLDAAIDPVTRNDALAGLRR